MNVEEEFQKLKNFIAEFKEEIKSQQLELDALKRNLENQQRELDDKKRYIDLLDRKLERLASTMINKNSQVLTTPAQIIFDSYQPTRYSETQDNSSQKSPLPISIAKKNIETNSAIIRPKQQFPAQIKNQSSGKSDNVTEEFNALADVQDRFNLKNMRNEFVQKYSVRAFSCTNFEARMNEPVPPPQFSESENIISSEYWAINNKGNIFLVFPNVRQYTNNHHTARAMGEIFSSNFMVGKTYTKIFVQRPAIFECIGNVWKLKVKGMLRLE